MIEFISLSQNEVYLVDGRGEIVSVGLCNGSVEIIDYDNQSTVATLNSFGESFSFSNTRYIVKGLTSLNQVAIAKFPLI